MAYDNIGGGAYGNSTDYEGNPFSDQSFSGGKNDERVIDFEHSSDQPDNMRATGAYDTSEPAWHQRLSQGQEKDNGFMDENYGSANNSGGGNNLRASLLERDESAVKQNDDRVPSKSPSRRRKSMICCDRRQAKYALFVTNLALSAILSLAIFSWSLVQNLNVSLNVGTTANDPSGCLDANKCLDTPKLLKSNQCAFQYSAVSSCATDRIKTYDYINNWPTPAKLRCANFPEGGYFSSPWGQTNSQVRLFASIGGFLVAGIYYMMARKCDCCVQFSLTLIEYIMYAQAIVAIVSCIIDNVSLSKVEDACSSGFKVHKYDIKEPIELCSLSGGDLTCDLSMFYWLAFSNLLVAVMWIASGVSLRSFRNHKANVPAI